MRLLAFLFCFLCFGRLQAQQSHKSICVANLTRTESLTHQSRDEIQKFLRENMANESSLEMSFFDGPQGLINCLNQSSKTQVVIFSHALNYNLTYMIQKQFVILKAEVLASLFAKSVVKSILIVSCNSNELAANYLPIINDKKVSWLENNESSGLSDEEKLIQLLQQDTELD